MTQASQLSLIESSAGVVTISNTNTSVSSTSGALIVAGGVGIAGTLTVAGSVIGGGTRTTSSSTPPSNPGVGDIWYNTLTDTVARYTSDGVTSAWLDITGPTVTNAFSGGAITQSLIPSATSSFDLGSPAYRFRTLYVTSSTIDIGGVPLSVSNGTLQVSGITVGAASSGTTSAFAVTNNTASTGTASGALVVTGGVGIGNNLWVGGASYHIGTTYMSGSTSIGTGSTSPNSSYPLTLQRFSGSSGNLLVQGDDTIVGMPNISFLNTRNSASATLAWDGTNLNYNTAQILTTGTIGTYANLGIPQNSQSAAYTTVASDAGWCIFHPASDANARTFTIAANASVPYTLGTVIQFINMSTQAVTIAINSDTLTWAQGGATGSRTLAQYGVANCIKIATTQWLLTGTNVT